MSQSETRLPLVLTIAGFDPSGGAGLIADVRAFTALGCSPAAALTSITFQNDQQVFGAEHLSAETFRRQVMAIVSSGHVAAVKTGMLPTLEVVREVVRLVRDSDLPAPVVDPVIRATSGYALIEPDALDKLVRELFPLACLVTPNIPEAEQITGLRIKDLEGMVHAAKMIREAGARAVLIKGGHLGAQASCLLDLPQKPAGIEQTTDGESSVSRAGQRPAVPAEAIDLLDNDGHMTVLTGEWIVAANLRGTGCLLSAAIAACMGKGMTLEESVGQAKHFVAEAIRARTVSNAF